MTAKPSYQLLAASSAAIALGLVTITMVRKTEKKASLKSNPEEVGRLAGVNDLNIDQDPEYDIVIVGGGM